MINIGTMVVILLIFGAAIGMSFYSGFRIGKKTVKVVETEKQVPVYEDTTNLFDKISEFIEDTVGKTRKRTQGTVDTVVTSDGIAKDDNTFY